MLSRNKRTCVKNYNVSSESVTMDTNSDNVCIYLECVFCTGLFPFQFIKQHIRMGHQDQIRRNSKVPIRRAFAVTELPEHKLPNCLKSMLGRTKASTHKKKMRLTSGCSQSSTSTASATNNDQPPQASNAIREVKDEPDSDSDCVSEASSSTLHRSSDGTNNRKRSHASSSGPRKHYGEPVYIKSRDKRDMVRYESKIHPNRFYEFWYQNNRRGKLNYYCSTCKRVGEQSRKTRGPSLPRPVIHVRNGVIVTDPDNPPTPHHCQGVPKPDALARDVAREMLEYAYTKGAELGSGAVYEYGKNRLERVIADLSFVDKEQARQRFPSSRRNVQIQIKKGCMDRGEPLPESFVKQHEWKKNAQELRGQVPQPKRRPGPPPPEDGYVVNQDNYAQESDDSE